MLSYANGSVNPIEQSLVLPKDANVCKHHIESHFVNATTKTPMQRIKDMESQLIRLGVDKKDLSDPDEDAEEELHRRRIEEDVQEEELDENDIKRKSTLKPSNQDKIDAMIIEAQQLRKDIEAMP